MAEADGNGDELKQNLECLRQDINNYEKDCENYTKEIEKLKVDKRLVLRLQEKL